MGELSRFWRESDHRYRLVAHRCGNCQRVYFPPRDVCPVCHRDSVGKMSNYDLSGKGEIVSFTVVHEAPGAFARQKPYVLAIIKLEEGPSLTGQIVDCNPADVDIGRRVHSVFRKVSEDGKNGIIQYGYKFALEQ